MAEDAGWTKEAALATLAHVPHNPNHPAEISRRLEAHAFLLANTRGGSGAEMDQVRAALADVCRFLAVTR